MEPSKTQLAEAVSHFTREMAERPQPLQDPLQQMFTPKDEWRPVPPRPIYLYRPCPDCSKMERMRIALICCAIALIGLAGWRVIEIFLP